VMLHTTGEKAEGDAPRQVSAIVAKNRHGPCGKVLLAFDGRHVLFTAEEAVHEEKPVVKIGVPVKDPWGELL